MKRIISVIICLVFSIVALQAQSWKKAENLFDENKFYEAANAYSAFLDKTSNGITDSIKALAYFKIARCYQELEIYDKARKAFDRAFAEPYKTPELYYYIGEMYRTEGNYSKAISYYEEFLKRGGNKTLCEDAILKCVFAQRFSNPVIGAKLKLQPDLRTQGDIKALCFWKDRLIYTTTIFPFNWDKNTLEKAEGETLVFMAEVKNDLLVNPKIVTELNAKVSNIQSFSIDETTGVAYFTAKSGSGKYTLYSTVFNGEKWQNPRKVDLPLFINITVEEVTIAKNGERLIFTGVSDDGFGVRDIWYTDYKAGVWSSPVNLGRKINTSGNERFPFVWRDSILFFASCGMPENYGGYDIYAVNIINDNFTSPVNLHKPFNSSFNDMGLVINQAGTLLTLFSDRSPDNKRSIYSSRFLPSSTNFYGIIRHKSTNAVIPNVTVKVFCNHERIGEFISDSLGNYNFAVRIETGKEYHAQFSKQSYFSNSFSLNRLMERNNAVVRPIQEVLQYDVVMEELVLGKSYELNHVFPPFFTTELFERGRNELNRIADFAKDNYWAKILLFSYCSLTDDTTFNRLLSNARMDSVVRYLNMQGIEKNRLITRTFSAVEYESKEGDTNIYSLNFRLLKDNSDTVVPKKRKEDFSGKINELYSKGLIPQEETQEEIPAKTPVNQDTLAKSLAIISDSLSITKSNFGDTLNTPEQILYYYVELYPSQQKQGHRKILKKIATETPDLIVIPETWDDGYTHIFIGRFTSKEEAQQLVERMKDIGIYSFIRTKEMKEVSPDE